MEEQEIEWLCPNCKKKKKQDEVTKKQTEVKVTSPKKAANLTPTEVLEEQEPVPPANEKKVEASKVAFQCVCLYFEIETFKIDPKKTKPINLFQNLSIHLQALLFRNSILLLSKLICFK